MDFWVELWQKDVTRRIIILLIFIGLGYLLRGMIDIFLLTFLLIYMINSLQKIITSRLPKIMPINRMVILILIYIIFLGIAGLILYRIVPTVVVQIIQLQNELVSIQNKVTDDKVEMVIIQILQKVNITEYLEIGAKYYLDLATNIIKIGFIIFVSILFSIFFLIEKERMRDFFNRFEATRLNLFYYEIRFFGKKFIESFGKVIQAQVIIALFNMLFSAIALKLMGFPQVLALAVMIFILGLIPVAGVILSLIPLSLIAFSVGGFSMILYVLIMIAFLHSMEAYLLNPKLLSGKMHLPVFVVFMVLIVSENLMGMWGLIIGVPLFVFVLDLINYDIHSGKL